MPTLPFVAGLISKVFMRFGCADVQVEGLAHLVKLLEDTERSKGILTYSNHISSVDEPFMWHALPISTFLDSRRVRWTLGASDIMFVSPIRSWFFSRGQVISTIRGGAGIYQPAIDTGVEKLDQGNWVHIFPEGKLKYRSGGLHEFKWGVARMLMEAHVIPHVLPIHIAGFEGLEPGIGLLIPGYIPRPRITITIGAPVHDSLDPVLEKHRRRFPSPWRPATYGKGTQVDLAEEPAGLKYARSEITAAMREKVVELERLQRLRLCAI